MFKLQYYRLKHKLRVYYNIRFHDQEELMSSPLAEAITASMVSSMDPMNAMTRRMAEAMIEEKQAATVVVKANAVTEIEALLTQAIERGADAVVIASYQKLLGRLSN